MAETTQVVSPEQGYVFHNRLTHSLKVAQIAKTIAEFFASDHRKQIEALGGIDPDAAEAAGLAHDLGHPPFGHIAEYELDRLVRRAGCADGFEGNAQSFRIACRLAASDAIGRRDDLPILPGLNLTRSTLNGTIKYPWAYGENPHKRRKWGYYSEEKDYFAWARAGCRPGQRSLIAEVMDWADDVTYAIHDLLDFYRAGLIPLEMIRQDRSAKGRDTIERESFLRRMFARRLDWKSERKDYVGALDDVLKPFQFDLERRYTGAAGDEQRLYHFSTDFITKCVWAIVPSLKGKSVVSVNRHARAQVDVLKELVWAYVILNPDLAIRQAGQRRAIRAVFTTLRRAVHRGDGEFFPLRVRDEIARCSTAQSLVRVVADYVAGMTERELLRTYRRLEATTSD